MSDKKIDDGGPAFPTDTEHQNGPNRMHLEGMSLRDYFAGKALIGFLNREHFLSVVMDARRQDRDHSDVIAEDCYALADAMIRARGKHGL